MKRPPSHGDLERIRAAASTARPRILVVDDDVERAAMLSRVLSAVGDLEVFHDRDKILSQLGRGSWDVAVVDFQLDDRGTGFSVLRGLRLMCPHTQRLLYSSHYSDALAIEARLTAHTAVMLDARRAEFAIELREMVSRLLGDEGDPGMGDPSSNGAGEWSARAKATQDMLGDLQRAAEEDAVVFVHGEQGTGKHLAAATLRNERARLGLLVADTRRASDRGAVRTIRVPPLRERRADLPDLCSRFLASLGGAAKLSPEALEALSKRDWWGNVAELQTVLDRACHNLRGRRVLEPDDLPRDVVPPPTEFQRQKDEAMTLLLLDDLAFAGSVNAAARHTEVPPSNFRRLMKRHGILRADSAKEPG